MPYDRYENPLISRYASVEMAELFSPQRKFSTWRRIWIALAQAQQELGLGVTTEQIEQLEENAENIDFDTARRYENKLRHDVMAHVHAYGDVCPDARPIIHLGATSCFVTDNTDLIILREALVAVRSRLATSHGPRFLGKGIHRHWRNIESAFQQMASSSQRRSRSKLSRMSGGRPSAKSIWKSSRLSTSMMTRCTQA